MVRKNKANQCLGYIFWRDEEGTTAGAGPLAKNIGPERTEALRQQLGLEAGDDMFLRRR